MKNEVELLNIAIGEAMSLPLFESRVAAGFPSPADDFVERTLDLNEHLIHHPAATFFVRVSGNSMTGAGIHSGDILIVDRSLTARDGSVIVAQLNGEFLVKRLKRAMGKTYLVAENPAYPRIDVSAEEGFEIWGVVTNCVHNLSQ